MSNFIFNYVKKIVPKISKTEIIALRCGTACIDREIFEGKVKLPTKNIYKSYDEKVETLKKDVNQLLRTYGNEPVYPNPRCSQILDFIKSKKFLSFIIDEKYDGNKLAVKDLSSLLTTITSCNPALGVTVMVPNSLGPGELIQKYGTEFQKNKYLRGLSCGHYIPCFGLTGPNNGSDAIGSIDTGKVVEKDGKKVITVTLNKRYITLSPISNLVGLAFNLTDPDNLLQDGEEGVTVALIESDHKGLKKHTHHNPMNAGFPNGTIKGTVDIELDQIIGGEKNAGNGWKMLMECLADGRAVCLPSTALASSKVATYGIINYSKHRKQFNIPIIKMEGVSNKIVDMMYNTWVIQSSVHFTNYLLDLGEKPSVISAIMKQQTTDRSRLVVNDAMDIHGGGGICLGYSNFLEKFYRCVPIGITVEGSNTLTKNLIIFGQGLNKSHPHIFNLYQSIMNDDKKSFNSNLILMAKHTAKLYVKSFNPVKTNNNLLERQTVNFALLVNFVALKAGSLKKDQYLSSHMADIFSNLYLAYCVRWYNETNNISNKLTEYCISRLLNENQQKINTILDNYKYLKIPLFHLKTKIQNENFDEKRQILDEILQNDKIIDYVKEDIYVKNTILQDLEDLNNLNQNSIDYKYMRDRVTNVGEFRNF